MDGKRDDNAQFLAEYQNVQMAKWQEREDRLKLIENISPDRLQEICKAEAEGRCFISPCKPGDPVFITVKDCHCGYEGDMGDCSCCDYVIMPCDDVFRYIEDEWECGFKPHVEEDLFCFSMLDEFGKTVFLSKEEAEAALKGGTP